MEPAHDFLQAEGSRELEGIKARGRPARSWEFTLLSACCKHHDKENLWVRFAILFPLLVINQWNIHLPCSNSWRLKRPLGSMHAGTHEYHSYLMFSEAQQRLLKGVEHCGGKT